MWASRIASLKSAWLWSCKGELWFTSCTSDKGQEHFRQKHLGIWRNQHKNKTPHLQLQCEVNPALRMWDMVDNTDDAFFNTCLRRIYKIRWQEKIQNEDLRERAGQEPGVKQILRGKWGWIEHTLRKPASHAKPWPGTRRGREAGLATVWGETLKQSWNSKGPTGLEWPEQPRTECDSKGS